MAMERVTVEQNGERFTLEVAEGTSDDEIRSFLSQQQGGGGPTAAEPQVGENVAAQAGIAAARPVGGMAAAQVGDAVKLAKIAGQVTPRIAGEFLSTPIKSVKDLASAYAAGHPMAGKFLDTPLKAMPGAVARGVGTALAAPESAFLMPYTMAAYEQAKIRANPNAPGLEYNPYAQVVRGEIGSQAPSTMVAREQVGTQNMAGEANRMRALANMPFGNVNAQERAILEEDRRMRENIRKKAYQKVMGPVVPGSF
jgi:hypothetical protein